jgi:hypothetical protein
LNKTLRPQNVEINIPVVSISPGKSPSQPEMPPPLAPDPESSVRQQGSRISNTSNREISFSDVKKCMALIIVLGFILNPHWSSPPMFFFLSGLTLGALLEWILDNYC